MLPRGASPRSPESTPKRCQMRCPTAPPRNLTCICRVGPHAPPASQRRCSNLDPSGTRLSGKLEHSSTFCTLSTPKPTSPGERQIPLLCEGSFWRACPHRVRRVSKNNCFGVPILVSKKNLSLGSLLDPGAPQQSKSSCEGRPWPSPARA